MGDFTADWVWEKNRQEPSLGRTRVTKGASARWPHLPGGRQRLEAARELDLARQRGCRWVGRPLPAVREMQQYSVCDRIGQGCFARRASRFVAAALEADSPRPRRLPDPRFVYGGRCSRGRCFFTVGARGGVVSLHAAHQTASFAGSLNKWAVL